MYWYWLFYGDLFVGDYVGDFCCCNINDSYWDEFGYWFVGDIWCYYCCGFYYYIISVIYWLFDVFIFVIGYWCGYYFYWV